MAVKATDENPGLVIAKIKKYNGENFFGDYKFNAEEQSQSPKKFIFNYPIISAVIFSIAKDAKPAR